MVVEPLLRARPVHPDPAVLKRAQNLVVPRLRTAVADLHPAVRRIAEYHLGWVDADGQETHGNPGKAVRAALALLGAEAAGTDPDAAVAGAAAVELLHNFTLLHDDIMDADPVRRHRPAAWAVFGIGRALLAGDALLVRAVELAQDVPGRAGPAAARLLPRTATALVCGQADDSELAARRDTGVTVEEYRRMAAGKTGSLLGCSTAIGAVLAEAPLRTVGALYRFGVLLGQAFQAVDDVLGIWGEPDVTGKPMWSDLREHKKSLPILAALRSATPAARELADLLADGAGTTAELARAAELVEAGGGRAVAEREADECVREADETLATLTMPAATRAQLRDLTRYLVGRDR